MTEEKVLDKVLEQVIDFASLGLPEPLVRTLEKLGITKPTPIQIATIPLSLGGSDILASAQTGSGKTLAYIIPLIMSLLKNPNHRGLILTPTRELAMQVLEALNKIRGASLKAALLIGGSSMSLQMQQLRAKPKLIVGTPGRIFDHLNRKTLVLSETHFFIIDEADRMLDMGFGVQLEKIADFLPRERQTLMFSATVPVNIERLAKKYLKEPQRVAIDSHVAPPKIKHEIIHTSPSEKFSHVVKELEKREGSIILFVKTKRGADKLSFELRKLGHSTEAIHGDLQQRRRDRVIHDFRTGKCRILVATDIAARGLDIPHIMHVINVDLPQCPEDYIHRIGRTARAGAEGNAVCLIGPHDRLQWQAIHRLIDPESAAKEKAKDKTRGAPARPKRAFGPRGGNSFNRSRGEGRGEGRREERGSAKPNSFWQGPKKTYGGGKSSSSDNSYSPRRRSSGE